MPPSFMQRSPTAIKKIIAIPAAAYIPVHFDATARAVDIPQSSSQTHCLCSFPQFPAHLHLVPVERRIKRYILFNGDPFVLDLVKR